VTAQRVDLDARMKALQTSVDRLLAIMRDAKDPDALIKAEGALSERQAELDSLRAQRDQLGARIDYSTVDVNFVADQLGGPEPQQYSGFFGQVERGWDGLVSVAVHFVMLFGLLLPWFGVLAVVGGIGYGLLRLVRARRPNGAAETTTIPGRGRGSSDESGGWSGAAADAPLEQHLPLGLRQPTPDAVRFADGQGMGATLGDHRATPAHLLGAHFPLGTGPATLAVGVEEHR
jgi:hypothetical protein